MSNWPNSNMKKKKNYLKINKLHSNVLFKKHEKEMQIYLTKL